MIKVRLEFRNVKVKDVFEIIKKLSRNFKVWRYDGIVYVTLNVKTISELNEMEKNIRSKGLEFSYSRIDFSSTWWERCVKM